MKKLFLSCFLAAGLAFVSPVFSSVPGPGCVSVSAAETETAATEAPVPLPSGWQQDANGWYYLKDGTKLTGWQDIDGLRYYFDASGYRVSGNIKIDGKYYLFRPETEVAGPGALCVGTSGLVVFQNAPDTYYYLASAETGVLTTGKWVKSNGGYYYANSTGEIKLGTIKVKKKLYHITAKGRMNFYGRSSYDKGYYYARSNGVLKTGFQTINKKRYYFDPQTGKRASGIIKVGNDTYYFKKNGTVKSGWVKTSGGTKVYYYDSKGCRVSGWYTIKSKKYYFDPKKDNTRLQSCWRKIKKKYYYFDASGVMQTGFFTVDGKRYYASSSGVRQKGWKTVNGRKYYIDPKTYVVKTGWLKYNNKKYYLNPNQSASTYGAATTGFVSISSGNGKKKYWYYFNNDGSMYTGWLTQNGKRYYFSPSNGRMFTGKHKISGKEYNFGTDGVCVDAVPTGPWRIEVNRRSCFVVVYRGSTPVRAFVCSTAADGVSTPTGNFTIMDHLRWHELKGPSWGQYCSHITPDILFHSVPNTRYNDNYSLEYWEYNKLGRPASAGCIRLTVEHAKYIYDNVPVGTPVLVSDSVARPSGIVIETALGAPNWQKSYDPTDPNI